jgi:predicted PurR-regulated permease PerM
MKIQNAFRVGLIGTLGVGLGYLILSSIVSLAEILTYVGAALFLALGIEPIILFFERRHFKRWLALLTVLVALLVLVAAIVFAVVPVVAHRPASWSRT